MEENTFMGVTLHMNNRLAQIHVGQFFRNLADNMRHWMTCATSSHVSIRENASQDNNKKLMHDINVLDPGSWPKEELDI